jgi:hypothetical protein
MSRYSALKPRLDLHSSLDSAPAKQVPSLGTLLPVLFYSKQVHSTCLTESQELSEPAEHGDAHL